MTAVWFNNDAGPEGGAVTELNSGAFLVGSGGTGSALYRAAAARSGPYGVRLQNIAGQTMVIRYKASADDNRMAYRGWFQSLPAAPGANTVLVQFRSPTGMICQIVQGTSGALEFWRNSTTKQSTLVAAGSVVASAHYCVDAFFDAVALTYDVAIYNSALTQVGADANTVTAFNGAGPFSTIGFQINGNGTTTLTMDVDEVCLDNGRTSHIGPPSSNVPPTPTITSGTPSTAVQNETVPLRGTATDPDGTVVSTTFSIPGYPSSLTGPPTVTNPNSLTTASFAAAVPGTYTVRLTAIDNSGDNNFDEKVITVSAITAAPPPDLVWTGSLWK